jgi:hypothetical protein
METLGLDVSLKLELYKSRSDCSTLLSHGGLMDGKMAGPWHRTFLVGSGDEVGRKTRRLLWMLVFHFAV